MQKFKKSKGFTLTELAIVIAVIAILIAVLVPTFVSLINKAKLSSDSSNVYNFNTALSTNVDTPKDMNEVASILEENGYNMPVEPVTSGNKYVWDSENNKIYMVDSDTLAVVYPENITAVNTEAWYDFKTRTVVANSAATTYDSGTSTYTVSAVSGWSYLVEAINDGTISSSANIKLASDLTFTSEYTYPLKEFSGTLDGKKSDSENYTISGLTISGDTYFDNDYYSFIQYLKGGTIQNVTFEEVSINAGEGSSDTTHAALIGCIYDGSTISNVKIYGSITSAGRAAGFVGKASYTTAYSYFTIENCENHATITSIGGSGKNEFAQAGGFISQIWTNVQPKITNCTNYGDVYSYVGEGGGKDSNSSAAGFTASEVSYEGQYTNCVNYGKIYTDGYVAGGIIGYNNNSGSTENAVSLDSCKNYGTVTGPKAGGIAGWSHRVTYNKCENDGAVVATNDVAGGIVATMYSNVATNTKSITLKLENCSNTATVTATTYAGGIIGEACCDEAKDHGDIKIENCSGGTKTISGGTVTVAYKENDEGEGNIGRIAGRLASAADAPICISISSNNSDDNSIGMIGQIGEKGTVEIVSGKLIGGVTIRNASLENYLIFDIGTGWDWKNVESYTEKTTYLKGNTGTNTWTEQS